MKTRKQLLETIEDMEAQLSEERHKQIKTGFINAAGLPPCKSLACINCEHYVCMKGENGAVYPLGCGKDIDCPDFRRSENTLNEKERQSLLRVTLSQERL